MFSPYALSNRDRYCRLFPPSSEKSNLSDLRALGLSMRSNWTRIPFARMSPPPPAGYTYAGQFILHDVPSRDRARRRGHTQLQSVSFIAAHSAPAALREGILYIRVLQPALHYELDQVSKIDILRKLKQRFGAKVIRDIRFRVG